MSDLFRLKHMNGHTHAEFFTANAAYACQRGIVMDPDPRVKDWFYFENADGERVVLHDARGAPGHAYAILAAIEGSTDEPCEHMVETLPDGRCSECGREHR